MPMQRLPRFTRPWVYEKQQGRRRRGAQRGEAYLINQDKPDALSTQLKTFVGEKNGSVHQGLYTDLARGGDIMHF